MKYLLSLFFGILSWSAFANSEPALATSHPLATTAGMDILKKGGNAFDAAVAVSAVLAVVEPYNSGLGGGGFWLLHHKGPLGEKNLLIDGRETAPFALSEKAFLTEEGRVARSSSQGALSTGIPGEPAALVYINKHYGKLSLKETLKPAIELAEKGFPIDTPFLEAVTARKKVLQSHAHLINKKKGSLLKQPELAKVFKAIVEKGHDGFYKGSVAKALVEGVQKQGGIWTLSDLSRYQIKLREPLVGYYHQFKIITSPPPSAGGLTLLTSLNILSRFEEDPLSESDRIHLTLESLRRAYCDRATHVGDPDFEKNLAPFLLTEEHIDTLKSSINLMKATPSSELHCGSASEVSGQQTTHFSVLDSEGNRVAATMSLNQYFGSGLFVEGVFLNNEIDDFSIGLGNPNVYGLVGNSSNRIEPGKRPVSSMMPTFIESESTLMIFGTPGGSRIPSMMLLAFLASEEQGSGSDWIKKPRYHHQYLPDVVSYEKGAFSEPVMNALRLRGHRLEPIIKPYGDMQLIVVNKKSDQVEAFSDPRGFGQARVGLASKPKQ